MNLTRGILCLSLCCYDMIIGFHAQIGRIYYRRPYSIKTQQNARMYIWYKRAGISNIMILHLNLEPRVTTLLCIVLIFIHWEPLTLVSPQPGLPSARPRWQCWGLHWWSEGCPARRTPRYRTRSWGPSAGWCGGTPRQSSPRPAMETIIVLEEQRRAETWSELTWKISFLCL